MKNKILLYIGLLLVLVIIGAGLFITHKNNIAKEEEDELKWQ